jgi:hypothetical protein
MAELKYAHHIITEPRTRPLPASSGPMLVSVPQDAADLSGMHRLPAENIPQMVKASRMTRLLWLDGEMLKGAFYMDFVWYHQPSESGPGPHKHDFDEVLGFIGCNPLEPGDLGGEMEIWLEDEKYTLNKTCLVFVPRGMRHCPMIARKVSRPFVHFSAGNGGEYIKTSSA